MWAIIVVLSSQDVMNYTFLLTRVSIRKFMFEYVMQSIRNPKRGRKEKNLYKKPNRGLLE